MDNGSLLRINYSFYYGLLDNAMDIGLNDSVGVGNVGRDIAGH